MMENIINVEKLEKRTPRDYEELKKLQAAEMLADMEHENCGAAELLGKVNDWENISREDKNRLIYDWYHSFKYFDETITNWLKANTELLSFKLVEEEREERKERLEKAFREAIRAVFFLGAGLLIGCVLNG